MQSDEQKAEQLGRMMAMMEDKPRKNGRKKR